MRSSARTRARADQRGSFCPLRGHCSRDTHLATECVNGDRQWGCGVGGSLAPGLSSQSSNQEAVPWIWVHPHMHTSTLTVLARPPGSTRASAFRVCSLLFRQRSLHPIGPQRFRNANVASGAHRGVSGESSDQSRAEDLHDSVVVSIRLGSIEWLSLAIIICTTQNCYQ